jgi:hypothetical protein
MQHKGRKKNVKKKLLGEKIIQKGRKSPPFYLI